MWIDVSRYRDLGATVHLPPEVTTAHYYAPNTTLPAEVTGDRSKIARVLRDAGYTVVWDDPNPAVALGARSSASKTEAARINGRQSQGRPRSTARLCPEPLRTTLMNLDKGTLLDVIFVALGGDQHRAVEVLKTVRQAREDEEVAV